MTSKYNKHIFICVNERDQNSSKDDCVRCGGKDVRLKFVQLINQNGLKGKVRANKSGCLDACELGTAVVIYPDNIWYTRVTINDVDEIFETSILNDNVVERLSANEHTWKEMKENRKANK